MAEAPYTALDIAKWFINATDRESGDDVTHLKVQKLIYYAQGWALALIGEPLFKEDLQAWAHGPVAPSVWDEYREYGYAPLPQSKSKKKIDGQTTRLLESVNENYGIYTAKKLEKMTHKEAPWLEARGDNPPEARSNASISKKTMKKFFADMKNNAART
jgi:uncharacterized phage-associated protein